MTTWKTQALENLTAAFSKGAVEEDYKAQIQELHAKIGQLLMENHFLEDALGKPPRFERKNSRRCCRIFFRREVTESLWSWAALRCVWRSEGTRSDM